MRNYVAGYYGIYKEDSASLGIHLTLRIWRHTKDEFFATIEQLNADIRAAGGDWTGTLSQGGRMYWNFEDDDAIQDLLTAWFHGTSQASNAFDDLMTEKLQDKSPRGREKRKFKLVPIKK